MCWEKELPLPLTYLGSGMALSICCRYITTGSDAHREILWGQISIKTHFPSIFINLKESKKIIWWVSFIVHAYFLGGLIFPLSICFKFSSFWEENSLKYPHSQVNPKEFYPWTTVFGHERVFLWLFCFRWWSRCPGCLGQPPSPPTVLCLRVSSCFLPVGGCSSAQHRQGFWHFHL